MEPIKKIVAENLKKARIQAKLEREQAANALNIDSRTLGHYETGRSEPKFETLSEMSKLYKKPVGFFFGENTPEAETVSDINSALIDKIISDLIDEGVLSGDINFEDLDTPTQQILLGVLNKHISKIHESKKRSSN